MFSLDSYYKTIYYNLLDPLKIGQIVVSPLKNSKFDIEVFDNYQSVYVSPTYSIYFHDQEPHDSNLKFSIIDNNQIFEEIDWNELIVVYREHQQNILGNRPTFNVYATSEKSQEVDNFCREYNLAKWYYFSHGLIAQYWFNDFKYFPKCKNHVFDKVFITFNNLISNNRSYRLNLVASIIEKNIHNRGRISLSFKDSVGSWQDELFKNTHSRLSRNAKVKIYKNLKDLKEPLIIDTRESHGALSAAGGCNDLNLYQSAFWHVVTETVFYDEKLHLTEKIFKPIVARRPFILVGARGNLAYLKSYGFKTFDQWIDESYDDETDPDRRIEMITLELEKLCSLSPPELESMYYEMEKILDYNFEWFYNGFKHRVVSEMLDNFKSIIAVYNSYQLPMDQFPINNINFDEVAKRFTS